VFGIEADTAVQEHPLNLGFAIDASDGLTLSVLYNDYQNTRLTVQGKAIEVRCRLDDFPFPAGRYHVAARLMVGGEVADWPRRHIGTIDVATESFYPSASPREAGTGMMLLRGNWSANREEEKC